MGLGGIEEALERIADALEVIAKTRLPTLLEEAPRALKNDPQVVYMSDLDFLRMERALEARDRAGLAPLGPDDPIPGPVREDGKGW